MCIVDPALFAVEQGFDVYVITDACGDVSSSDLATDIHEVRSLVEILDEQFGEHPYLACGMLP